VELQEVAELQVVLEGVPLPNERASLVRYALDAGATATQVAMLRGLSDRLYDNIDEVAEELVSVQPSSEREEPRSPREESGAPPGGDAYTELQLESGAVRSG
jgi:hypothetical protein